MTAKVLVVDDLLPNVKLLEAKLRAEYFEVLTACSGPEAIELAKKHDPDIVLLDVMMPGMDGFEACRILKETTQTCHIPVVMVTALDQQSDRLAGLKAGADDFLTKPVQDVALFARVRSLSRLKQMTDELRDRCDEGAEMGAVVPAFTDEADVLDSRVWVLTDEIFIDGLNENVDGLDGRVRFEYQNDARQTLEDMKESLPDLVVIDLSMESYDPLRLCSAIRLFDGARLLPVLGLARESDMRKLVRALDLGMNDYLMRPVDGQEMAARVQTQLRRKRYVENLRKSVYNSIEMAVTDPLTGLYNRRYLSSQLAKATASAVENEEPLSLLVLDVDHFKSVNDTYGHDIGDLVLKAIADRLGGSVRGIDLACRFGGEEFVFVMPKTAASDAIHVAERLRVAIAGDEVTIKGHPPLQVTVSIGLSSTDYFTSADEVTPQAMIKQADEALYRAKEEGRNRVVTLAA